MGFSNKKEKPNRSYVCRIITFISRKGSKISTKSYRGLNGLLNDILIPRVDDWRSHIAGKRDSSPDLFIYSKRGLDLSQIFHFEDRRSSA